MSHADPASVPASSNAQVLVDHLALTARGGDIWSSEPTPLPLRTGPGRIFGGQVIAQALLAAEASAPEGRPLASFHCRFLRAGKVEQPILYHLQRDLDGRSFTHRRIVAEQDGTPILTATVMLHATEPGLAHQPDLPPPGDPETALAAMRSAMERGGTLGGDLARLIAPERPFEVVPVDIGQWDVREPAPAPVRGWLRFRAPVPDRPGMHRAILGYISDSMLVQALNLNHGISWFRGEYDLASLDHMIWFHDDFRADDWLLYVTECQWARHGRTLTRGEFYRRDGRLVATVMQELLIRLTEAGKARVGITGGSHAD